MAWLAPILSRWPLFAGIASAVMLAIAHAFETFGGLAPCTLCYRQREVYWAALAVAVAGLVVERLVRRPWSGQLVRALLLLLFLLGAGVAAYHAGAEWKWWPGPSSCSGGGRISLDVSDLNAVLAGKPIHGPACDKAAWVFLGLSMAGWNCLISLGFAALSALSLKWIPRRG